MSERNRDREREREIERDVPRRDAIKQLAGLVRAGGVFAPRSLLLLRAGRGRGRGHGRRLAHPPAHWALGPVRVSSSLTHKRT